MIDINNSQHYDAESLDELRDERKKMFDAALKRGDGSRTAMRLPKHTAAS
jgi:hypothetical protein